MNNNINELLVKELLKRHLTISFVESFSGGLASKKIVDISGSSLAFLGSIVSYSTFIKETLLNIDKNLILKYSVASKEVALEMAKKGKEIFNSDIVCSFTGEAGPISNTNVKVGTVFIGFIIKNKIFVDELHFSLSRNELREEAVNYAFKKIFEEINKNYEKNSFSLHS